MIVYQLRIHDLDSIGGIIREGFTSRRHAMAAYRAALSEFGNARHRIGLFLVRTPNCLRAADWVEICSDGDIPGISYETLEQSHQLTAGDTA